MAKIKIRTQFLTLFMIIGLIPLLVIGILFFIQSTNILINNSSEHLASIQNIRAGVFKEDIDHHFSEFDTLLNSQAITEISTEVSILNSAVDPDEIDFSDFTRNNEEYLSSFIVTNNFHNIYFLSKKNGDVLYNFKNETGYFKSTGLSRLWQKAMTSEDLVFEDFSKFSPSENEQAAFIGKRYINGDGELVGVLVLQLSTSFIDNIISSREGLGDSGESYIVNYDSNKNEYEFRSTMITMGNGKYTIGYRWNEKPLDYWNDAIEHGTIGNSGVYIDSKGAKVLVEYVKLDIPWVDWYLITKIDVSEVVSKLTGVVFRVVLISFILLIIIGLLSLHFSRKLTQPIIEGSHFAQSIAQGDYNINLDIHRKDEIGVLAKSLKDMGRNLKEQAWLKEGKEGLDDALRGVHDVVELGNKFISYIVKHLDAQVGVLYLLREDGNLHLSSSYAFSDRKGNFNKIAIGEGLVGQSAIEQNEIIYTHVPTDSPDFNYGVSSMIPTCYISTPLLFEGDLVGVSLIGITVPVTKLQRKFIKSIKSNIAILLNSAKSSTVIQNLLEDAQTKQEELSVSNEELEQQTLALRDSEKDLQSQQEELRVTNEELEERTDALEKQRKIMRDKNRELEEVGTDLEAKAEALEKASQYKSEFLANMSHELRTPLNSILILSQLISNNKKGNLDEKQIKSAQAINSSGEDLLKLINEILDLSKVEAGKVEIHPEVMTIDSLMDDMERVYRPSADQKGINLIIKKVESLPQSIITDSHRLQQVLKNLLTNALKFTNKNGTVTLDIRHEDENIRFAVTDTGIGIPKNKQAAVFEAFKQADGSTSRKYGGTGLGLSISRELIKLLGGKITVESEEGKGSTFCVVLPIKEGSSMFLEVTKESESSIGVHVKDDREGVNIETKTLLIIEDDVNFAAILKEQAHDRGFKVLIAEDGETGLHFADYYRPCAIVLDIGLPGIDGWTVMERLKKDPELRHIPVHFMSGHEDSLPAMQMGAVGYMKKPITLEEITDAFKKIESTLSSKVHKLLIVEDDQLQRESLEELISGKDVAIYGVATGKEAYDKMKSITYDCVILDLGLEDMSGYDLLDKVKNDELISQTPIIIYTGRDLSPEEELRLKKYADSIIIKGAKSPDRLLEETALFLHRVDADLPDDQKNDTNKSSKRQEVLAGKNILIVDDDMRNIFALSNILEEKDINVIVARDGAESIEKVKEHPDIDLVLMDIMMPKMDGYEAMGHIRKLKNRESLPIIALTANAMKGDRSKCIEAGANDYLAKPVDNNKLISMLRVWMY